MKVLGILIGLLLFVAVALGGLYLGANWYTGQKIEKASVGVMAQWQELVKKHGAEVKIKEYKRQILGSEILTEIAWSQKDNPAVVSISFECQTKIKHGPFLGLKLGYFSSESACHLDQLAYASLAPFKGMTLLSENTLVNFDGSFKGKINIRPMQNHWQIDNQKSFLWKGCNYDVAYKMKTHLMNVSGLCHGFDFLNQEADGSNQLTVGDFQITSEALIPELTQGIFQAQKSQMQIQIPDGIKIRKGEENFDVKTVTLQQNSELNADKLSSGEVKLGVAQVTGPDLNIGPISLEFGFERIPVDAMSTLTHPGDTAATPDELQTILLGSLKADPQLSINKLLVEIGMDYFDFNMKFKMTPVSAQDLANPMSLMSHVDLSGQIEMTQPFYDKVVLMAIKDPSARSLVQKQSAAQLEELKQSGFIIQNGTVLKSVFSFQKGEILINDKPLGLPVGDLMGGFGGMRPMPHSMPPQMDSPEPSAPVDALPVMPTTPIPPTNVNPGNFLAPDVPVALPDIPKTKPSKPKLKTESASKPIPADNYFRQDH